MLKRLDVYKCRACGNIVEVMHGAAGKLICCGEAMNFEGENTVEAAVEKHKPVVTKVENGYKVAVGSTLHPMGDEHYIEWVELVMGNTVYTKFFVPGDEPTAMFEVDHEEGVFARAYCNLHGHWRD